MTDGSLIENEDPFAQVCDADERLTSFVAALAAAKGHDEKRELWLQAIDDSQLECDLRTLFGVPKVSS
jgi:hypothetical protein